MTDREDAGIAAPGPWLGVALSATSGLVCGQAFLPSGWRWLVFVALVPLLVTLRSSGRWARIGFVTIWAFGVSIAGGSWFPGAIVRYFEQSPAVGMLFYVGTIFVTGAIYYGVFALFYSRFARMSPLAEPIGTGLLWGATELLRTEGPNLIPHWIGNPWGVLGYTQAPSPALIQVADFGGVFAVSVVIVSLNAAIARTICDPRSRFRALLLPLLLLVLTMSYGEVRLARAGPHGEGTRIGLVQGNLEISARWRLERYGENLGIYLRLSRQLLSTEFAETLFWPEGAMTFLVESEPLYRAAIANAFSGEDIELVAGGPRRSSSPAGTHTNAVFAIAPSGEIRDHFEKEVLIPLAESPLFASESTIQRRDFASVDRYVSGTDIGPLSTRPGQAAVLVCQEAFFGSIARRRVAEGADYLLNPANDSWVGTAAFGWQQFEILQLRAVETRREVVRSSTSGPSGVIDRFGRIRVATQPLEEAVAISHVESHRGTTLYALIGDLPLVVLATAFGIAALRLSNRVPRYDAPRNGVPRTIR